MADKDAELKEKWAERERILAEQSKAHEELKTKSQSFPNQMDDAIAKATEAAKKQIYAEAKVKAELLEKEVEANKNIYALKIETLEWRSRR